MKISSVDAIMRDAFAALMLVTGLWLVFVLVTTAGAERSPTATLSQAEVDLVLELPVALADIRNDRSEIESRTPAHTNCMPPDVTEAPPQSLHLTPVQALDWPYAQESHNGLHYLFHLNGELAEFGEIDEQNRRQGYWESWSEQRVLLLAGHYDRGIVFGKWEAWHENGTRRALCSYDENGESCGEAWFWKEDGTPCHGPDDLH